MKKLFTRWGFLFPALVFVALALATSAEASVKAASIQGIRLDPQLRWPGDLRSGQVIIDTEKAHEIVLKLNRGDCPPNALCRELDKGDVEIRLPLKERHQDPCGALIYKGAVVQADGGREELTIIDNTDALCTVHTLKTEVRYRKVSGFPALEAEVSLGADTLVSNR